MMRALPLEVLVSLPSLIKGLFIVGKNSSLKFIKPQVQGTSLCTWSVLRKELCCNYQNSLERLKLGKVKRGKRDKLKY